MSGIHRRLMLGILSVLAGAPASARAQVFQDWHYHAPIRFAGYTAPDAATNLPVLVRFASDAIAGFSYSQFDTPAGSDLRFAAADGVTPLPYEVERWDPVGTSLVWVLTPEITGTDTVVHAYWGGTGAGTPAYATNGAAWSNGFVGVWHMGEDPAGTAPQIRDSTGWRSHGRSSGAMATSQRVSGIAGDALLFDGTNDYINCSNAPALAPSNVTVSAWVRPIGAGSNADGNWIITKGRTAAMPFLSYGLRHSPTPGNRLDTGFGITNGFALLSSATTNTSALGFVHLAASYDRTAIRLYLNGRLENSLSQTGALSYALADTELHIGHWGTAGFPRQFQGIIDEVQVSGEARASNWIWAAWLNVASNASFQTVGPVELQASNLTVRALAPSAVGATTAAVSGRLISAGGAENPSVLFCIDTSDQGTNDPAAWATRLAVAVPPAAGDTFAAVAAPLAAGQDYVYRTYATNSTGAAWSPELVAFRTIGLAGITNTGATNVTATTAILRGAVVRIVEQAPTVEVRYWTDGAAATSTVVLGVQTGTFQAAVAGLWPTTAYAYAISASNAAGIVWSEAAAFMTRGPFHVATNGSNAYPFDTWATAATTISNALAAATNAGDAVLVAPGTYPITAGLSLTTAVSVIGVGPSTNAIIVCRLPAYGSVSPIVVDHPGAFLDGFAITGCVNQLNYGVFGPLYVKRGLVQRCIVARNSNYSNGGGCISGGVLRDSVVEGNSAVHQNTGLGGGLRVTGGAVSNCLIVGNYAVDGGGGLYVGAGNVDACTIISNTTARASIVGGGGVDLEGGRLINCLIARNSLNNVMLGAYQGAGVRMTGGSLVHCTITANACSSLDRGSGVYMTGGGVTNCIVYGNGSRFPATAEENISATGGAIAYTCAQPRPAGTGNIDLPPELAAGSALDGGLAFGSPCVDAALPLSWVTADQAGAPRPADGDGDGAAAPDMGCRERIAAGATFECSFSAAATEGTNSLDALFSAVTTGPGTGTVTYCWDWESDGLVDAAGPELAAATHLYASPGVYTVTLVCTNAFGGTASASRSRYIFVWSPDAYVATSGAHVAPYDTWAKAATTVQAAVDAVLGTGTVHVAAGTYAVGTKIAVTRGTRLVAEGGYAATTLRSPGPSRILDLFHPGALIDGFTLSGISLGYPHSGAIYMTGGEVRNCRITGNTLGTYGGAVHMEGGFVHDCILTNNGATHQNTGFGGGVWMSAGVVSNCLIENNRCMDGAGGVYSSGGTIRNCRIASNSTAYAPANAGGLWLAGGRAENCLIVRNRLTAASPTGFGGGVYMTGGALVHCTVADNQRALDSYSGIYMTGGGVTNSVAFYNGTAFPAAGVENVFRSGGVIGYSCAQPAPAGTANIGDDPSFIDRSGGDYRLAFGSPCADTATNLPELTVDLDGSTRPQDGNGDGAAVSDMGAYERPTTTATFACAFSAIPAVGTNSVAAVFTATVAGPGTSSVFYTWDWTSDGENDEAGTDLAVASHTYAEPGFYSVTLNCTNALGQAASQTRVAYIVVYSSDAYVSTTGANRAPYHTWATAARNLADAVTVVADNGTVHVSNGIYSITAPISIGRPITVLGVDGPTNTVLRSTGSQIFLISHPAAEVDGFLLTGGSLGFGYYGAANLAGGTLRRCIVAGNSIGSCGGVYVATGLVDRCVITNNTASHQNSGFGGGVRMTGGLVCDSLIAGNTANDGGGGVYLTGGLVSNCTIRANRRSGGNAGRYGGGVWMTGGLLWNCDIRSNVVVNGTDAGGGGVYMAGGTNRNCLIAANTVTNSGAGVYMDAGRLQNATIAGNVTLNPTGAVSGLYMSGGAATNCIVYYNIALGQTGGDIGGAGTNIGRSCSPALTPGSRGNISSDPRFADTNASSYRLRSGSPCADSGLNLDWVSGARDLDGNPRVIRSAVDMGAYELAPYIRTVVIIR